MINYSLLREVQKRELESAAIVKIDENFYEQVAELLKSKKEEAIKSKSILAIKEYENIKKIIMAIQTKREEKIALQALRGENNINGCLTKEEVEMMNSLTNIIENARHKVKDIWSNEENNEVEIKKIKITRNIEQYRGLDSNVYGPFKIGEEPLLPKNEAEWLLRSRMAEIM